MHSSPPQQPAAPRSAASRTQPQHRRTPSLTDPSPQTTTLPSIRQLQLPPPGIAQPHPGQSAEHLASYTYPAPPHFVHHHPSSSSTTTISAPSAPQAPLPPPPQQQHLGRDRDVDVYTMAESDIEDTEQPPKKKRRRQALSCTGAVPHYLPPQPPPGPGPGESSSPNPSTYAVAPSGFTPHALYSQIPSPPPHAYHQHLGPQVHPHAPPYDQGRPQSNSSPVQAQRYDIHPQQHQPFPPIHSSPQIRSPGLSGPSLMGPPLPHKEQRSPPFQPAMLTKKSPLSLAAITSPTSPRQKNFHAQTLKLGERLRPLEVSVRATEDPAAVVMRVTWRPIDVTSHQQAIRHPGDPGISLLRATDSWRNLNVRAHDGTNSIRDVPTVGIPHDPLGQQAGA
ncbi:hypothetical protein CCMSSC00406_0008515 [Pleurotus cornucopiae]|uniref:Uncharacterized protein n=1 Tax=Pleurotus cornucopiae TaxID=5321 RepID=A0ACB7IZD2_PLECO|nr:hypothetical protein CCMSSC00406_0008515 [Pleurotus cornucopiae]